MGVMLYFVISILMMIIPVYFIEYCPIDEGLEVGCPENDLLLPQTASGKAAWLLCVPRICSFAPLFLAGCYQKEHSKNDNHIRFGLGYFAWNEGA